MLMVINIYRRLEHLLLRFFSPGTGISFMEDFVVVECDRPVLICQKTATFLDLLRVGPAVPEISNIGNTEGEIETRYGALFNGVDLLRDFSLKLHIDESVRPIVQPVRRILFAIRVRVENKINQLVDMDIIENYDGPTSWVSPLVIEHKRDEDIRVCVDMRRANEAIIRERHQIPTIDELLYNLNGSSVFSKLDLKMGFH